MSDGNINLNVTTSSFNLIPSIGRFWLYLVFLIPSIICLLFVLYYLLFDRILRHSLHNHVLIVLLITVFFCELTQYPWMLYYYYFNSNTWQRSTSFCLIWGFIDGAIYILQLLLFAWATIERHILIFHDKWVSTRRKRFFIHYLPLIIIMIYWFIFYSYVYFYPPCKNTFDYSQLICVKLCLFNSFSFHAFETLFHNVLSSITIVVFSVALFLRILYQKYRIRQQIQWRKHRKMTIQLLSISLLYLLITAPWALIVFLRICGLPSYIAVIFESYAFFTSYYIAPLFPFVALLSLPELRTKFRKFLHAKRSVCPEPAVIRNVNNNQVHAQ